MKHRLIPAFTLIALVLGDCGPQQSHSTRAQTTNIRPAIVAKPQFDLLDTTFYTPVDSSKDPGGLMIAGDNDSETIRNCEAINGLSISELEELMRPGQQDERSSQLGFLGKDERLVEILVSDNEFVKSKGLTHRELAIPVLQICQHAIAKRGSTAQAVEIEHGGVRWRVQLVESKGFQYSPFDDKTKTNIDYAITNLDNKKMLKFSGLVPIMIERYGFYEGHGTPYRVEPADLIDLLGLPAKQLADE